jgi:hypothetical protein
MAIYLFLNLKIPFVGFASPSFLVARLRKFAKKKTGGNLLLSKYGDITIFFPGNLATFKPIFHKNALYESHWICLWSPSETIISHKKREENAHLISHVLFS